MTFKRVLLNTCQEEFEGAQEAREVGYSLCPLWLHIYWFHSICNFSSPTVHGLI